MSHPPDFISTWSQFNELLFPQLEIVKEFYLSTYLLRSPEDSDIDYLLTMLNDSGVSEILVGLPKQRYARRTDDIDMLDTVRRFPKIKWKFCVENHAKGVFFRTQSSWTGYVGSMNLHPTTSLNLSVKVPSFLCHSLVELLKQTGEFFKLSKTEVRNHHVRH